MKYIYDTAYPHATAYICRELDFEELDLVVEDERHLLLDCRQRIITDVLSGVSLRNNSTLQLEGCELDGFNFTGSSHVSGGTILVENSRVVLANCSVCPLRNTIHPAAPALD